MYKFNQWIQERTNPVPNFSKSNSCVLGGIYSATVTTKLNVSTLVLEEALLNICLEYMEFFASLKENPRFATKFIAIQQGTVGTSCW